MSSRDIPGMSVSEIRRFASRNPAFCTLLILLFWLPLPLGSNRPWSVALFELLILVLCGVIFAKRYRNRIQLPKVVGASRLPLVLLFLVSCWQLIQLLPLPQEVLQVLSPFAAEYYAGANHSIDEVVYSISLDRYATWEALLLSVAMLSLFVTVLIVTKTKQHIRLLLYTLVASGLFQAAWASVSLLAGSDGALLGEKEVAFPFATGTFMNRNHLAGFLELTLAAGVGLLVSGLVIRHDLSWRQRLVNWLAVLLSGKMRLRLYLLVMVIALILTHSRMGNFAFFTSLIVVGGVYAVVHVRRGTHVKVGFLKIALLFGSLILVDLYMLGNWFGVDRVVQEIESTRVESEARTSIFDVSVDMALDFHLVGAGSGTFASVFPVYYLAPHNEFYDHVHNEYIEFVIELGLPMALLLSVVVVSALHSSLMVILQARNQFYIGVSVASLMGIVALLIHGFVDFNLRIPSNAAYFVVLLALSFLARSGASEANCDSPLVLPQTLER